MALPSSHENRALHFLIQLTATCTLPPASITLNLDPPHLVRISSKFDPTSKAPFKLTRWENLVKLLQPSVGISASSPEGTQTSLASRTRIEKSSRTYHTCMSVFGERSVQSVSICERVWGYNVCFLLHLVFVWLWALPKIHTSPQRYCGWTL